MYISNNQYQKNTNISSVFESVWRSKNISRIAISKKLDLYRSTITNIISSLIEKGLVKEGTSGNSTSRGGRKPIFLSINKDFACVIGIELQYEKYSVVVLSIDGSILYKTSADTPAIEQPQTSPEKNFIYAMDSIIESLIEPVEKLNIPVIGLCVSIPGIVDVDRGIIKSSEVFGLHDFNFSEAFYDRYGIPCIPENDARCLSWKQFANNEKEDFICVLTKNMEGKKAFLNENQKGIGVGISIAIKGNIIHGSNFSAGEYISTSWKGQSSVQTGLPDSVIDSLLKDDEAYSLWIADLFKTLTVFIPLLGPSKILFYGQEDSKKDFILATIADKVPQFNKALEKFNVTLDICKNNEYEIAEGAAFKYLQRMFVVMETDNQSWIKCFDWDAAFELQEKGLKHLQLHKANY